MALVPMIDKEKCIGCGSCTAICPDVFEMNNEGKAIVKKVDFNKYDECIEDAKNSCPTEAISLKKK